MKTCKFIFYIDKSPIYLVHEKLFCPRSGYAAIVPAVRLHLDVVAGYEPLPPVQLRAVPVHVVLLVQHLQDLVLAEAQLVVGRRIEVMLGNGLHYCSNFSVVVVDVSLGWELSVQKHTRGDQKNPKCLNSVTPSMCSCSGALVESVHSAPFTLGILGLIHSLITARTGATRQLNAF